MGNRSAATIESTLERVGAELNRIRSGIVAVERRFVPNDAVSAATIVPTTTAVEREGSATSTANAAKAAMLRRRRSS